MSMSTVSSNQADSTDGSVDAAAELSFKELHEVISIFKKRIPLEYASDWDNVGLLIEPSGVVFVKKILLTIDLTEQVLDEAISHQVQMIVAYHPPLFRPFKKLTQHSWKERIAIRCIENGIAVFSPHTALDAIQGGINDWLLSPFDCVAVKPIESIWLASNRICHHEYSMIFESQSDEFLEDFNKFDVHCYKENKPNYNLTCDGDILAEVLNSLKKYGIAPRNISSRPKLPLLREGMGRSARLSKPIAIKDVYESMKVHLGLKHLRLALSNIHTKESKVSSIAVCAGSGASILQQAAADIYITGEMSHHEVLDAVHKGTTVILCEHTNTERGFLKIYRSKMEEYLQLQVIISELDSDPNQIV